MKGREKASFTAKNTATAGLTARFSFCSARRGKPFKLSRHITKPVGQTFFEWIFELWTSNNSRNYARRHMTVAYLWSSLFMSRRISKFWDFQLSGLSSKAHHIKAKKVMQKSLFMLFHLQFCQKNGSCIADQWSRCMRNSQKSLTFSKFLDYFYDI